MSTVDTCSFQLQLMASNHQLILCFVNVILKFERQPIKTKRVANESMAECVTDVLTSF